MSRVRSAVTAAGTMTVPPRLVRGTWVAGVVLLLAILGALLPAAWSVLAL